MRVTICLNGATSRNLIAAAVFALAPSFAAPAFAAGFPGAFWTQSGRDMSGVDGTYSQGFFRQGALIGNPAGLPLQAYARLNWRMRSINADYFNSYTPYAGAMVSSRYLDAGVEFGSPHYSGRSAGNKDHSVFINWFRYLGLKSWSKTSLVKALPLSSWGTAAYDLSGENGSSTLGWVKLEADVLWMPKDWMAGPFISYDWRLRSHRAEYFNYSAPSLGFVVDNREVQFGIKYSWRDYPLLKHKDKGPEIFISIYHPWDLKLY